MLLTAMFLQCSAGARRIALWAIHKFLFYMFRTKQLAQRNVIATVSSRFIHRNSAAFAVDLWGLSLVLLSLDGTHRLPGSTVVKAEEGNGVFQQIGLAGKFLGGGGHLFGSGCVLLDYAIQLLYCFADLLGTTVLFFTGG